MKQIENALGYATHNNPLHDISSKKLEKFIYLSSKRILDTSTSTTSSAKKDIIMKEDQFKSADFLIPPKLDCQRINDNTSITTVCATPHSYGHLASSNQQKMFGIGCIKELELTLRHHLTDDKLWEEFLAYWKECEQKEEADLALMALFNQKKSANTITRPEK